MPLTPTDVANKQFKIAFRGYSLDEVDAFLDEVETELSRLLRENAAGQDPSASGFVPSGAPVGQSAAARPRVPALSGMEGQEAALRTLLLAQRTADEAIAEARAEAEQIVSAARAEADTTLGKARSEADTTLGKARSEAETTLGKARTEAQSTLGTAQRKAASVDEDVAARIQAATGDLDQRRRDLEVRIEELRSFEREYRTRLKAYLETQLRDLDSRQGNDDAGAGVPAKARAAAVGLTPGSAAGVIPRPEPRAVEPVAPARPPREAGSASVRAVPPLAGLTPEPVGPFASSPTGPVEPTER